MSVTGAPPASPAAARWDALLRRLETFGAALLEPLDDDPAEQAEAVRYLTRFLAAGFDLCLEHDDTQAPAFTHLSEDRRSWGLDNPDCLYLYARIDGRSPHRIAGRKGSARHLEVQVNTGHYADGRFTEWRSVASLAGDELTCDADGRFTIDLVPAGHATSPSRHVLHLTDDASFVVVRQYFGDWAKESPADLAIERLDAPRPRPALDLAALDAHLALLDRWLDDGARCWQELGEGLAAHGAGTIQPFVPPAEASGLGGLAYGMGGWRCPPERALIVRFRPPAARYWSVSLCDRFWQSIDFGDRQSSLNDHQARLDADGGVTAVISRHDPGVWNWLDPGRATRGTLAVRYLLADGLPPVHVESVAVDDLDAALGGGVRRCSPADRRAALAERRAGLARRYRR